MAVFAIYKCIISAIVDDVYIANPKEHLPQGQELLENVLLHLPTATKKNKNGEEKPYTTKVLSNSQNIHIMLISDPKDVKLTDEQQVQYDADHFPPCHVIFDNRDDIGLLAIEKSSDAFRNNTDRLRDVLEDIISKELFQYHLKVELNIKKQVGEFWEVVDLNRSIGDWVKSIKFSFPNPNNTTLTQINRAAIESEYIRALGVVTRTLEATRGTIEFGTEDEKGLRMKNEEDLAHMVCLCCDNGYDISVLFAKSGEYKYGDEKRMLRELNMKAIEEHIQQTDDDNTLWSKRYLIDWLDDIYKDSQNYIDAHTITNTRKRRTKRLSH